MASHGSTWIMIDSNCHSRATCQVWKTMLHIAVKNEHAQGRWHLLRCPSLIIMMLLSLQFMCQSIIYCSIVAGCQIKMFSWHLWYVQYTLNIMTIVSISMCVWCSMSSHWFAQYEPRWDRKILTVRFPLYVWNTLACRKILWQQQSCLE